MNTMKKMGAGAVLGGALLAAGGLGFANAAPPAQSVVSDGNVNVTVAAGGQQVGVIKDVSLGSAQALAASACPTAGITPEAFQAAGMVVSQIFSESIVRSVKLWVRQPGHRTVQLA